MKVSNNEITVQRGEAFSIDRSVINKDGSPYIVSSQLRNPHILITISSSPYSEKGGYCAKYYLPWPSDVPRFYMVNVINLKDIGHNGFPVCKLSEMNGNKYFMEGTFNGKQTFFEVGDAVFCAEDSSGNKIYKYWVPDGDEVGSSGQWKDYVFRFVKFFDSNSTAKLTPQTYYYSINIVSGNLPIEAEKYDNVIVLLSSTKLSVLSNLRGRL